MREQMDAHGIPTHPYYSDYSPPLADQKANWAKPQSTAGGKDNRVSIWDNYISGYTFILSDFIVDGCKFYLKEPLSLRIDRSDDIFVIEYKYLDIIACEFSEEETELAFKEYLAFIWHRYAQKKDEQLHRHAQVLKNHIKKIVRKVENFD